MTRMTQLHSRGTLAHNCRTSLFKDLDLRISDLEAPWPPRRPRPRSPRDITAFPLSDHRLRSHRSSLGRIPLFHPSFLPNAIASGSGVGFFSFGNCSHRGVQQGLDKIHDTLCDRDVLYFISCSANSSQHTQALLYVQWSVARVKYR